MTTRRLTAPTAKPIKLKPVRPNAGLTAWYQAKLDAMIDIMQRNVTRAVMASYRANPPEVAMDESPAAQLEETMAGLSREWSQKFAAFAAEIGGSFGKKATAFADRSLKASLKDAGFTVDFTMTREANDVMRATIAEQVGLIRSIPQESLTQVQGMVMRSVQTGRDMGTLSAELQQQFVVTKRRAAIIARDQNGKATASITRVRQQALGITQARWVHSTAGRHPRPEHVAFNGKLYDITKGAWLENRWTWPGMEINCRCISAPIIPGIDTEK